MNIQTSTRPAPIMWAIVLTAVNAVGGVIFTAAMPDLNDRGTVVTVSAVAAAIMLVVAGFVWAGARWGAIGMVIVNALNILMSVPAYFEADGAFIVGGTASIVLSVMTIALVLSPDGRAFWNRRSTLAT